MIRIHRSYPVEKNDFVKAGEVSSQIKKIMKQVGVKPGVIRKVSIAAYEAEMNIIIHSNGGCIEFSIDADMIRLTAKDQGPGIEDVEQAMKEGFSTATKDIRELGFGAGMGLPNIRRVSDDFKIESSAGRPTCLTLTFYHVDSEL